jgi:hypothetical protein
LTGGADGLEEEAMAAIIWLVAQVAEIKRSLRLISGQDK